jgi:hypothetical protein
MMEERTGKQKKERTGYNEVVNACVARKRLALFYTHVRTVVAKLFGR